MQGGIIIEVFIEKIYKLKGIDKVEYSSNEVLISEKDDSVIDLEVIIDILNKGKEK